MIIIRETWNATTTQIEIIELAERFITELVLRVRPRARGSQRGERERERGRSWRESCKNATLRAIVSFPRECRERAGV